MKPSSLKDALPLIVLANDVTVVLALYQNMPCTNSRLT